MAADLRKRLSTSSSVSRHFLFACVPSVSPASEGPHTLYRYMWWVWFSLGGRAIRALSELDVLAANRVWRQAMVIQRDHRGRS